MASSLDFESFDDPDPGEDVPIEDISHVQIHRVLLEGAVHPVLTTPSFLDFERSLDRRRPMAFYGSNPLETVGANSGLLVTCIVQGAYRDALCDAMTENRSMDPAKSLLVSLHDKIRALIPNRPDLHDQLSDHIRERRRKGVLQRIVAAAQALEQLESEARAETTNDWIVLAQQLLEEGFDSSMSEIFDVADGAEGREITESFLITSILYLLFKAELCEQDKKDYYLDLKAKFILEHGVELERKHFIKEHGALTVEAAPNSLKWVERIVAKAKPEVKASLKHSIDARHDLIFYGWVNELLFSDDQVALPEVLALDLHGLKGIRDVTRIAVAGSALALHASSTAGQPASILESPDTDDVYRCRAAMVLAMNESHGKTQSEYESIVAGHVEALAKIWNPQLDEVAIMMLHNQTVKVLRGEDAVIKVLEGRVKKAFGEIVIKESQKVHVPKVMKTGNDGGLDVSLHTPESRFSVQAIFQKHGMAFYASDLALAASKAFKIIDLVWRVYGDALLQPMILKSLES